MSEFVIEEEEFTTQFNGQTLLRIISQAKPHLPWMVGFLFFITLTSLLDSIFTFLSKRIIDEGILRGDLEALFHIISIYGSLILAQAASVFGFIYLAGGLGERIQYDLREKMFSRLQELSLTYYDQTPVGWMISRVTSDSQRIAELVSWGILDITWGVMSIFTALIFMFFINWKLTIIVSLAVPVLILVASQFKKYILNEYREVRKLNSKITGAYNENITGVRVSKALVREEKNLADFQHLSGNMYRAGFKAAWLSALFLPIVQLISAIAIGSIAWFGSLQIQSGGLTIGGIQAFISYVTFMLWPIQELARVYAEMQRSIASAERVFSLIDSVPEIRDRENAVVVSSLKGDIEFENVDFYYEPEKPILKNFNLRVKQGETLALVGPTGAGKTTIVNLLARFYEPKRGVIRIAGKNYTDFTLHSLQARIGIVLQTPHLFSGTIRENIRYGRMTATDNEIIEAAKLAGAHEFIKHLKEGYDEEVGEGGGLISVGQKQLISLARAVLASPDIFIMDEATSSVDTLTEALIQKGMEQTMQGRTSFVIAHRLSTIKKADRILVIENGRIAEMGNHAELIHRRDLYYRLYTQQFRQTLEKEHDPFGVLSNPSSPLPKEIA